MKLIVDIPDFSYQCIKDGTEGSTAESDAILAIREGKPYEEKPKGTWVEPMRTYWNDIQAGLSICSLCGATSHKLYKNFCANCGEAMRGEQDD